MSDQDVVSKNAYLAIAADKFSEKLSVRTHCKTSEDRKDLIEFASLFSPSIVKSLADQGLTDYARQIEDAVQVLVTTACDGGKFAPAAWQLAVKRLLRVIDGLSIFLNIYNTNPSAVKNLWGTPSLATAEGRARRRSTEGQHAPPDERPDSGVYVNLKPPSIKGATIPWKHRVTYPLKIFALLNNDRFEQEVRYEVFDNLWPEPPKLDNRGVAVRTVKNYIIPNYTPHLELEILHGFGVMLKRRGFKI